MCIYLIPQHGLCNRLSWLCGFYAHNKNTTCPNYPCTVYVKWTPNNECNGHFLEIFSAPPNVKFVRDASEVPSGIKKYAGQYSVPMVFKRYYAESISHSQECEAFGILQFKNEIEQFAEDFMKKHFSENTIGFHVRRTDHVGLAKSHGNFTSDEFFFKLMKNEINKDPKVKFFLAADNRDTQESFLKRFPNRTIIIKKIEKLNNSLRHTTLFDTGLDMCLLTHCKRVEGTFHSSFSRVALMMNIFRRNEFDKADAELKKQVFRGHKYAPSAPIKKKPNVPQKKEEQPRPTAQKISDTKASSADKETLQPLHYMNIGHNLQNMRLADHLKHNFHFHSDLHTNHNYYKINTHSYPFVL